MYLQSTPLNRVTLVPEHFYPIKRNLGVDPIKRSELILFYDSVLGQVTRLSGVDCIFFLFLITILIIIQMIYHMVNITPSFIIYMS